jgi:hypothetical protein
MWSGSCGGSGNQRPKRKCWGSATNTNECDSDNRDLDQPERPAKQQRHATNGQTEMLWTRSQLIVLYHSELSVD